VLGRVWAVCPWLLPSLDLVVENCQQVVQRLIHPPKVTHVAPVDGVRVMAEVVFGQLPQGLDLVEDHWPALKVGIESGALGGHGWLRVD